MDFFYWVIKNSIVPNFDNNITHITKFGVTQFKLFYARSAMFWENIYLHDRHPFHIMDSSTDISPSGVYTPLNLAFQVIYYVFQFIQSFGSTRGLMWTQWWTSGFHKMLGSSRVAAQLAASQEWLSSMSEWVSEFGSTSDFIITFIVNKLNKLEQKVKSSVIEQLQKYGLFSWG
jgi:hypothetical protein